MLTTEHNQPIERIIARLREELELVESFIRQNVNLEYWQGVKYGIELALDGFKVNGISTK